MSIQVMIIQAMIADLKTSHRRTFKPQDADQPDFPQPFSRQPYAYTSALFHYFGRMPDIHFSSSVCCCQGEQ
jgi:hypothetical protein